MNLDVVLQFIAPPFVGAIIGLFTNWLAIKMLFRPLTEKRILGLRLPFTPGILPRERSRMSQAMGETVATDLLDADLVASRLRSVAFREAIKEAASRSGHRLLEARPSELASGIDGRLAELVKTAGLKALSSLATSEALSGALMTGTSAALDAAASLSLSECIPPPVLDKLAALATSKEGAACLGGIMADTVMAALQKAAADGRSISDYIDPDALRAFTGKLLDSAYPLLVSGIKDVFADRTIRASMERLGARVIRRALDRFNTVQRFFIGLGQYDKAILDNMPATIADFSDAVGALLEEDATRAVLTARVSSAVAGFCSKPLVDFYFLKDAQAGNDAKTALAKALSGALSAMDAESASLQISRLTERTSVGQALAVIPGLNEKLGRALSGWMAGLWSGESGPVSASGKVATAFVTTFSQAFRQSVSGIPLGRTVPVDDETLDSVAAAAADALAEISAAESANMLRSMDIGSMVIEKIDSLDMIDVERMILRVVDKELWAITLFGGLLGAIIGIFQSLLFLLR